MSETKREIEMRFFNLFWEAEEQHGYEAALAILEAIYRRMGGADERSEILQRLDRMPTRNITKLVRELMAERPVPRKDREAEKIALIAKIRRWDRERRKRLTDKTWRGPGATDYPLGR